MAGMTQADALGVLGLPPGSGATEIRAAWRRRVFESHPDHGTGSDAALAEVNAAYAVLRAVVRSADPRPADTPCRQATRPTRPGSSSPRRAEVATRLIPISAEEIERCRGALAESGEDGGIVPDLVRSRGRRVSYIFNAPMRPGRTCVALPTAAIDGKSRGRTQLLAFRADRLGRGEITVPDEQRETLFSGARSIRLHFTGGA